MLGDSSIRKACSLVFVLGLSAAPVAMATPVDVLTASELTALGNLPRTHFYRPPNDYANQACWNWAVYGLALDDIRPTGPNYATLPSTVFGYLQSPDLYQEVPADWRDVLNGVRTRYSTGLTNANRDAHRRAAIDSTMRLLLARHGFVISRVQTPYSIHIYYLKRSAPGSGGHREVHGPNFQHMWLEVTDARHHPWIIEHFPGDNLTLRSDRQPEAREDADYGVWSANLTRLLQSHVTKIRQILDPHQRRTVARP